MSDEQKNEMAVLFPEMEVQGIKLRPWALGDIADLTPTFAVAARELITKGFTLNDLDDEKQIMEMAFIILPHIPRIISVTAKMGEEEVRKWDLGKSTTVFVAIIYQNLDNLKNCFGPVKSALLALRKSG